MIQALAVSPARALGLSTLVGCLLGTSAPSHAALTMYTDRDSFSSDAGALFVDDYESPAYQPLQSDASMSAVVGRTSYITTGWPNQDMVVDTGAGNHIYCAGCNGSFTLNFTHQALAGYGVHAVGFDYFNRIVPGSPDQNIPYFATVTFADGTADDFEFSTEAKDWSGAPFDRFFGVVSTVPISRIDIGLAHSGTTTEGDFGLDNLAISAPVPEPSTAALCGLSLALLVARRVRRKR